MPSITTKYAITVQWGDCDPANIVFYPNYFAWFDAASHALINPVWNLKATLLEDLKAQACPLVEATARFLRPSKSGQEITFESEIVAWDEKRFTIQHRGYRDGDLLIEGKEIRFIAAPHPDHPERITAIRIPAEFKEAFQR
jgi:4-hydroxybenzoyl-CoA thioesterase